MKSNLIALSCAVIGGVLLLVFLLACSWISAVNSEANLRAQFNAQEKANHSVFDRTWKIIQQEAQIPEKERDSFRETYVGIMSATQGVAGNGQLASFFTQAKIDITADLFRKLMTTIEAQRMDFDRSQQKLLDIKGQHDALLGRFPSKLWLSGTQSLEVVLVTSDKTEAAFSTGRDNASLELFQKD